MSERAPELVEVKADCPFCGSRRFVERSRFKHHGTLRIGRVCRDCGGKAWTRQVLMSEVEGVRIARVRGAAES